MQGLARLVVLRLIDGAGGGEGGGVGGEGEGIGATAWIARKIMR